MAIIVLNGADFSANNIGKIDMFVGFSATTKAVFQKFGITENENDGMQRALNTFVNKLVSAQLWGNGKIDAMCLPFLAAMANGSSPSAALAIKDVIRDSTDFFVPTSGSSIAVSYSNGGVVPSSKDVTVAIPKLNCPSSATSTAFHYSAFVNDDAYGGETYSDKNITVFGQGLGCIGMLLKTYNSNGSRLWVATNNTAILWPSALISKMVIGTISPSHNGGKAVYYEGRNGELLNVLSTNTDRHSVSGNPYFGYYNDTTPYPLLPSPVSILTAGGYLSADEVGTLYDASKELVAALHTYGLITD